MKRIYSLVACTLINSVMIASPLDSDLVTGDNPVAWLNDKTLTTHNPQKDKNEVLMIASDDMTVTRYMWWNYGVSQHSDNKYVPERFILRSLASTLKTAMILPNSSYTGAPIVDQYKEDYIMRWSISRTMLQKVMSYFKEQNVTPNKEVRLLIEIKGDPELKSLSLDEMVFLHEYFTLSDASDRTKMLQFFATSRNYTCETISRTMSGKPDMIYDSVRERLFWEVQKMVKDCKIEKIAPEVIKFAVSLYIAGMVKDSAKEYGKLLVTKTKTFLISFTN